jgi:membrane protein DedA with SNARE-associated domain
VGAAARAATGQESLRAVLATLELALLLGGTAQYLLARGPGRRLLYRVGRYVGLTPVRLERAAQTLQRGGVPAIALGMLAPGVRALTITACGLADLDPGRFMVGLVVGDSLVVGVHVLLGYLGGAGLRVLAQSQHRAVGPLLGGGVLALVVVGLGGWVLLRRRRPPEATALGATVQAWEEASCPLCLGLAALRGGPVAWADRPLTDQT